MIDRTKVDEYLDRMGHPGGLGGENGENPPHHSPYDENDRNNLEELLINYEEKNSQTNFNNIKAFFEKKDASMGAYFAYDIIEKFGLPKPVMENDKMNGTPEIGDYNFYELEQIRNAKSMLKYTKEENGFKRTFRQMGEVSLTMLDMYAMSMNGSFGHDLGVGAVYLTGAAAAYMAIAAGNIIYGAGKFVGKFFKNLRAPKGTAEAAKDKKDKIVEMSKSDKKKSQRAKKQAKIGKKISKELLDFANKDVEENTIDEDMLNQLPDEMKTKLLVVRGEKGEFQIDKFQEELTNKSSDEVADIRKKLLQMKNRVVLEKLSQYNSNLKEGVSPLSNEQMKDILTNTKFDKENNQLILPPDAGITIEDIGKIDGLEAVLKKNAEMPKITDLSDNQVVDIARRINFNNDEKSISYDEPKEGEQIDADVKGVLDGLSGSEHYYEGMENEENSIGKTLNEHELTSKVLREVQARNRQIVCQDLDAQMQTISAEIDRINAQNKSDGELSMGDTAKREALRILAAKKVQSLENAGIVETLSKGSRMEKNVITEGEKILTPDIEKTEKIGRNQINEIAEEQELGG